MEKIPIFVEDKLVYLSVSADCVERAIKDPNYLQQLWDESQNKDLSCHDEEGTISDSEDARLKDRSNTKDKEDWTKEKTSLLIETYRNHEKEFETTTKRHEVWNKISNEMKKLNSSFHSLTGQMCSSKISSLTRTYKNVKDSNSKSGNSRKSWFYYDILDEVFSKKTWVKPIATASEKGSVASTSKQSGTPKKSSDTKFGDYIKKTEEYRKEKLRLHAEKEGEKRKRHEDRLQIQKEILEVFKKQKN